MSDDKFPDPDIRVQTAPLVPPAPALRPDCGAVVDFLGVVRGTEDGRPIAGIDYEAFTEMALHQLAKIAAEATGKFALCGILLWHRVGFVPAGEASLFLRVASERRAAAFDGSRWIIEALKTRVPIWKNYE